MESLQLTTNTGELTGDALLTGKAARRKLGESARKALLIVDKANDALKKALSRTALVDDLKKLAEIDERVRKGEREAHNLDTDDQKAVNTIKPKRIYLDFEDAEVK